MYALKTLLVILYLYCTSVVSLSALMKAVLRLEAMLWYRGSRDVISARAEVMFLIMWWAAALILVSSGSNAKSLKIIRKTNYMCVKYEIRVFNCLIQQTENFVNPCTFLIICSQVVRVILFVLSTTGGISSCTDFSTAIFTRGFNCGWVCSRATYKSKNTIEYTGLHSIHTAKCISRMKCW